MNKDLLDRIIFWGKNHEKIRAMILVGSHARREAPADCFSDLDIGVFVTDHQEFSGNLDWLGKLAPYLMCEICEAEIDGFPEVFQSRLAIFEDGTKVDFIFYSIPHLEWLAASSPLPDMYRRGYKVLFDKDGKTRDMAPPDYRGNQRQKPDQKEFTYAVSIFFSEAFCAAKSLPRNELWHVKIRDEGMKHRLLQMLEWRELARSGWEKDIWFIGKHMHLWLDEEIWRELDGTFARFNPVDSARCLLHSMNLYRRLAQETAEILGLDYPHFMESRLTYFIKAFIRKAGFEHLLK